MLPALLAAETREQIASFLETTFSFRDPALWAALESFLNHQSEGLFKGPYLSLELPYRKASAADNAAIPLQVRPDFVPYQHQCEAWNRLSSQEQSPRHTLVTTGTSSGKTECFLFPVLDHCARHAGAPGIKAIILYPMNALATDQARRLAEIIDTDPALKGRVRAGMYVGGLRPGEGRTTMGESELITSREALRDNPPDILLTNYKMLDLLLLRPEDRPLWQGTAGTAGILPASEKSRQDAGAPSLRYLVVDELHTFDGAQGADVACLIRRLRSRLNIADADLTCVGTSATIADNRSRQDAGGPSGLAKFASAIFATAIVDQDIVGETRLSLGEHQLVCEERGLTADRPLPDPLACLPLPDENHSAYLARLGTAWFGDGVLRGGRIDAEALGTAMLGSDLLPLLLRRACGQIQELEEVAARLAQDLDLQDGPELGGNGEGRQDAGAPSKMLLLGFLALLAEARWRPLPGERLQPVLAKTQVQIWVRELSRLGRVLSLEPRFRWLLDETHHLNPKALPPWFCRECGSSGWLGVAREGDTFINGDRQTIYTNYFQDSKHTVYITEPQARQGQQLLQAVTLAGDRVCPSCLWFGHSTEVGSGPCPNCGEDLLHLHVHRAATVDKGNTVKDSKTCPCCAESGHLAIVGSQSASLASIALGHLYTHPLNTAPKLLAFTDSVQDASHRAGFFQARTYRMGLRTAVARVINAAGPLPLLGLGKRVLEWWIARAEEEQSPADAPADMRVLAHLTPPDLTDLPEYREAMAAAASPAQRLALRTVLERRLDWEFGVEFGHQSRRGRTLEKAAAVHVVLQPALLQRVVTAVQREGEAHFPRETPLSTQAWQVWVSGILEEARRQGAIWHPYLQAYAESACQTDYALRKGSFARYSHEFAPGRGRPRLLGDHHSGSGIMPLGVLGRQQSTWFVDWSRQVLSAMLDDQELHEYGRILLQALSSEGMLEMVSAKGQQVYALRREAIELHAGGELVRCPLCNAHRTVAGTAGILPAFQSRQDAGGPSIPCLSKGCAGTLIPVSHGEQQRARFYRDRYLTGTLRRIVAHEHTGLLERDMREQVEDSFKGERAFEGRADNFNLLTCTSTMEMGINIGDLSSTMLCSVPPNTASYLQRIGRAGRGTGCALILSMATSRSHDLHFFADPHLMMSGEVQTPAIFLEAPEVLSRHFVAFVLDHLVAEQAITVDDWDRFIRQAYESWQSERGPLKTLVSRLHADEAGWRERFLGSFDDAATPHVAERLAELTAAHAMSEQLGRLMTRFEQDRSRIDLRLRLLRRERDELKKVVKADSSTEERLEEVEHLIKAQQSRRKYLDTRQTWSVLVDQGVLPNYAFPETGVTLNAQVYFPKAWSQVAENHEWVRGAGEAIRDLAPFNHFYANRRRFDIQRVEIGDPAETVSIWRFCSSCRHLAEHQEHEEPGDCPECGASDWCDLGRLRNLHRLSVVASVMPHFQSLATDDNDDRQQERYWIEDFFSIDHTRHEWAHAAPSLPFGFEMLGQVTLRQVNMGLQGAFGAVAKLGGEEVPEQGYMICKDCGVVAHPGYPDQARHTLWCQGRTRDEAGEEHPYHWVGADDGSERRPYLYRELRSEALRLLLPTGALESQEETASFTAALGLGLRLRFGGEPGHLLIRSQPQPLREGEGTRNYLLIFDQVPGGTGYLREIARPEVMREILQSSLDHMLACSCRTTVEETAADEPQDPNPAGCYKCLLSYGASRQRESIRREVAVRLLSDILEAWPKLEVCPNRSLGDIPEISIEESALEKRFRMKLQATIEAQGGSWRNDVIGGKPGHAFTLGGRSWKVVPQVKLGRSHGVTEPSQPDFLIDPVAARPGQLPVAVFLDGYRYHVHDQDGRSEMGADLAKRRAIRASQRYLVWSLSWRDLDGEDIAPIDMAAAWDTKGWNQLQRQFGQRAADMAPLTKLFTHSLAQLVAYLERPHLPDWQRAIARYWGFKAVSLAAEYNTPPREAERVLRAWSTVEHDQLPVPGRDPDGSWRVLTASLGPHLRLCVAVDSNELMGDLVGDDPQALARHIHAVLRLDDHLHLRADSAGYTMAWRRFQAMDNWLQFLPGAWVATHEHRASAPEVAIPDDAPSMVDAEDWASARGYVARRALPLFDGLASAERPAPEVGYELLNDSGEVIGMAELAWPDLKPPLAVLDPDEVDDRHGFDAAGWDIHSWDENGLLEHLQARLQKDH